VQQLVRAERLQKGGRAAQCIVVLIVLIAIFLIMAVVRRL
jgi:hypothetical protein